MQNAEKMIEQRNEERRKWRAKLKKHPEVRMEYCGYGDELTHTELFDLSLSEDEELINFLMEYVELEFDGFWNNEGGQGSVTWYIKEDKILVEHGENITRVEYTDHEY